MDKKKSHGVQLLIRAVVRDPEGKVLSDTRQKPSKSFVLQFLEFLYGLFDGLADYAATATDGSEDRYYQGASHLLTYHWKMKAAVNVSTYGIVVGTGDTAETNADIKLETQLTEGIGAGNITHGEQVIETTAVVGANVDLETKRAFTNSTGSTITVKEAGIYTYSSLSGGGYFCIIRDVLGAPGVDVPDLCSLTVYYTLRTTV